MWKGRTRYSLRQIQILSIRAFTEKMTWQHFVGCAIGGCTVSKLLGLFVLEEVVLWIIELAAFFSLPKNLCIAMIVDGFHWAVK